MSQRIKNLIAYTVQKNTRKVITKASDLNYQLLFFFFIIKEKENQANLLVIDHIMIFFKPILTNQEIVKSLFEAIKKRTHNLLVGNN